MQSILMPELQQLMQQQSITILDIREEDEYEEGHIAKSLHIPMSQIHRRHHELSKATTYYVLCYSGSRSYQVCYYLSQLGYRVVNIMGGISTYRGRLER